MNTLFKPAPAEVFAGGDAKIVDAAKLTAGDDAVAAAGPVDLLADDRHGARVLDQ